MSIWSVGCVWSGECKIDHFMKHFVAELKLKCQLVKDAKVGKIFCPGISYTNEKKEKLQEVKLQNASLNVQRFLSCRLSGNKKKKRLTPTLKRIWISSELKRSYNYYVICPERETTSDE